MSRTIDIMADGGMPKQQIDRPDGSAGTRPLFIVALGLMMIIPPMTIDMYLPAFPRLATELGHSQGDVQLTLSLYLISYAAAQLFWGVVSDRFGRRRPLIAGLVLYSIASILCARATSLSGLCAARILQGLFAAAGPVTVSALVRDLHAGTRAAQIRSMVGLVSAWAPMLAPIIGGQILRVADWPAIFWALSLLGFLPLAALPVLPAGRPGNAWADKAERSTLEAAAGLLTNRKFLGYTLQASLQSAALFGFLAVSPFVYIGRHHVPSEWYGFLTGVNVVGIMVAGLINTRFVRRVGIDRMLTIAATISAIGGTGVLIACLSGIGGLAGILVPTFFCFSAIGITFSNATAGATENFPAHAGLASGILGFANMGSGALGGWLVGIIAADPQHAQGWLMFGCLSGVLLANQLLVRGRLKR